MNTEREDVKHDEREFKHDKLNTDRAEIGLSSNDEETYSTSASLVLISSKRSLSDSDGPKDEKPLLLSPLLQGDDQQPESKETLPSNNQERVLVNIGHPPAEQDIFLTPKFSRAAKVHQIDGIRFLYKNVVDNLENFSSSTGLGCILAHSMGLGKTFQACAFSEVFLRHTNSKTVLIVVPKNVIGNWVSEFNSWLPSVPRSDTEQEFESRSIGIHVLNDETSDLRSRSKVITNWTNQGGVLLIGYELFLNLYTQRESIRQKNNEWKNNSFDKSSEHAEKKQYEDIYSALITPGPGLLICDEGQRIKNMNSRITDMLKKVRTRRRVILTGFPLQNNLLEYWCMVDFVRPNYLGPSAEFKDVFERPIRKGQCVDSKPSEVKLMKQRAFVLHSLLQGIVHRKGPEELLDTLPHQEEHVLLLRMTTLQRKLYNHHMSRLLLKEPFSSPILAFADGIKIWNHSDVLYKLSRQKGKVHLKLDFDQDTEENPNILDQRVPVTPSTVPINDGAGTSKSRKIPDSDPRCEQEDDLFIGYNPGEMENVAKTDVFFNILQESVKKGDRILLFSQSLYTLDLIEEFLQRRKIPKRGEEHWRKGESYFRLDGSCSGALRDQLVSDFNANPKVLLFLISTRAGGIGINLTGANRVVLFDASWNPCHDAQAIARIYRYGQTKDCFVYRLISDNSLEKSVFDRQLAKLQMSDRVVDGCDPENTLSNSELKSLTYLNSIDPPVTDFGDNPNQTVTDIVLRKVVRKCSRWFTQVPFQRRELLLHERHSTLTDKEKEEAKRVYDREIFTRRKKKPLVSPNEKRLKSVLKRFK